MVSSPGTPATCRPGSDLRAGDASCRQPTVDRPAGDTTMLRSLVRSRLAGTGRAKPRGRPRPEKYRPSLEVLDDRCCLSAFTVTNLRDAGFGSLRQAIA